MFAYIERIILNDKLCRTYDGHDQRPAQHYLELLFITHCLLIVDKKASKSLYESQLMLRISKYSFDYNVYVTYTLYIILVDKKSSVAHIR